jgi:hypothetical protein
VSALADWPRRHLLPAACCCCCWCCWCWCCWCCCLLLPLLLPLPLWLSDGRSPQLTARLTRPRLARGAPGRHYASLGTVTDEAVAKVLGDPPAAHMWADDLGGLQIALFDAVGKHLGVPVSALLGSKVRSWVPISWWSIDAPPEDWAAEGAEAVEHGAY